jgi:hypothetical protein
MPCAASSANINKPQQLNLPDAFKESLFSNVLSQPILYNNHPYPLLN